MAWMSDPWAFLPSPLCLIPTGTDSGTHVGAEEYGGHAQRAHETGALSTLCTLSSHAGMAPNAAEMASNILLRWVVLPTGLLALLPHQRVGQRCFPSFSYAPLH